MWSADDLSNQDYFLEAFVSNGERPKEYKREMIQGKQNEMCGRVCCEDLITGVSSRKILFVENTGTISFTKAEDDSPKAPKIRRPKWEKWMNVKVGTLVREVKTTSLLTRRSSAAYKKISIIPHAKISVTMVRDGVPWTLASELLFMKIYIHLRKL